MSLPAPIRRTLILLALLGVLEGLAAAFFGVFAFLGPAQGRVPVIEAGLLFAVLAVWSFFTLIRVARLRRWGRTSLLLLAAFLTLVGAYGTVFDLYALVHGAMAPAPGRDQVVLGLFYLALAAIGIGWLVYFNRPSTRALFAAKR